MVHIFSVSEPYMLSCSIAFSHKSKPFLCPLKRMKLLFKMSQDQIVNSCNEALLLDTSVMQISCRPQHHEVWDKLVEQEQQTRFYIKFYHRSENLCFCNITFKNSFLQIREEQEGSFTQKCLSVMRFSADRINTYNYKQYFLSVLVCMMPLQEGYQN